MSVYFIIWSIWNQQYLNYVICPRSTWRECSTNSCCNLQFVRSQSRHSSRSHRSRHQFHHKARHRSRTRTRSRSASAEHRHKHSHSRSSHRRSVSTNHKHSPVVELSDYRHHHKKKKEKRKSSRSPRGDVTPASVDALPSAETFSVQTAVSPLEQRRVTSSSQSST